MAKKAYIGIDGTARKVKKIYLGIDDVARRVKKAYIGIGGVARPVFSEGCNVAYYGHLTQGLPTAYLAAATVGNYAIFAGGMNSSGQAVATAKYCDTSLTQGSVSALLGPRFELSAATVGSYALFHGGLSNTSYATVAYDSALSRSSVATRYNTLFGGAGTTVGDYAIFAGGNQFNNTSNPLGSAEAVDSALTVKTVTNLKTTAQYLAATTFTFKGSGSSLALFGGGATSVASYGVNGLSKVVTSYDSNLTVGLWDANYFEARRDLTAVTLNGMAVFAGGIGSTGTPVSTIQAYLPSGGAITASMMQERAGLMSAVLGEYIVFFGGRPGATGDLYAYEVYDSSLTCVSTGTDAKYPSAYGASASIGNSADGYYALFSSGYATWTSGSAPQAYISVFNTLDT